MLNAFLGKKRSGRDLAAVANVSLHNHIALTRLYKYDDE